MFNPKSHLKTATALAKLMDAKFNFFGFKFGIDPILGLFPGGGDLVSTILSFYIVWIAFKMKVPAMKIFQMIINVVLDFLIGILPIVGDIADFFYQPNLKNLEILKKYTPADIIEGEVV